MVRLSAVIITFNEEKNIGRCLESLAGIVDEIIVVDSGSTDDTEKISLSFGARFVSHPFEGYIEQKNYACALSTCDYVLSIDADEALSPELKQSITELRKNWTKSGYSFNRLTNYCGKWIHHCGWYPDKKLRLFKKGSGKWGGSNPHDEFFPDDDINTGFLQGDLLHYSYYSISDHIRQVNNFTEIEAMVAFKSGRRTSMLLILIKPLIRFLRDYIFRLGFADGIYGFIICRISSQATFIKNVKLYLLQKKKKS